jgi:mono/diheme cytochrome c family protein
MRKGVLGVVIALAVAVVACGDDSGGETPGTTLLPPPGDAVAGLAVFNGTCITCHGPGGVGVAGLGKPLTTSEFAAGLTDAALLAFLDAGRPADDPLNTTGIAMPPRGGNPALTDADLMDVIAFVRTING